MSDCKPYIVILSYNAEKELYHIKTQARDGIRTRVTRFKVWSDNHYTTQAFEHNSHAVRRENVGYINIKIFADKDVQLVGALLPSCNPLHKLSALSQSMW